MKQSTNLNEAQAQLEHAEEIINKLLDIAEQNFTMYSLSQEVAQADDWLKWINHELTNEEIKAKFDFPQS